MMKLLGIALGAGVTSAVLIAVTTTASPLAGPISCLAPLPLMIAGFGFGHLAGGGAALVASAAIAATLGIPAGLLFLVALGLPAWYLPRFALLSRAAPTLPAVSAQPAASGQPAVSGQPGAAAPVAWSSVPGLMLRLAAAAALPVLLAGGGLIWRFGGYDAAIRMVSARVVPMLPPEALALNVDLDELVRFAPLAFAASGTLLLALNLWFAARAVKVSDRLPRPWPNLPDHLRLPRTAAAILGVLALGRLLPAPFGIAAGVLAAALGTVFAFEGLATAHVLTRGIPARPVALGAVYLTVLLLRPGPVYALALLGCIDSLVPGLRQGAGIKITKLPKRRG